MGSFERAVARPPLFRSLTSLEPDEFWELLDPFESVYQITRVRERIGRTYQRARGAGRHPVLDTPEQRLFFILCFVKLYPLYCVQGFIFGLAESKAWIWVQRLLPVLNEAMGANHQLPTRRSHGRSLNEILEEIPELAELGVLLDGTERPVRRPKDPAAQERRYSGKKKRHTVKNIVLTHPVTQRILYLGETVDGTVHDKRATDQEQLRCRDPVPVGTDSGLQGLVLGRARIVLPLKKPKGGELTESQQEQNRALASVRVAVEHALAGFKRLHVVSDTLRAKQEAFADLVMVAACGLHNFRVAHRFSS